jgi:hypothetical protein
VAGVGGGRSEEDGRKEIEIKVAGARIVEGNFGRGRGSPSTAMPEEEVPGRSVRSRRVTA